MRVGDLAQPRILAKPHRAPSVKVRPSCIAGRVAALVQPVRRLCRSTSSTHGPLLAMKGYGYSPLFPTFFDLRGIALAAWTLVAFAIGVFAGC